MKKNSVLLLIIVLFLTGCSGLFKNSYCPEEETTAAMEAMENVAEEWDDAIDVAFSTSRIGLAGPISNLQEIKRNTGKIEAPPCLEKSRDTLVTAMQEAIDGFLAFSSDKATGLVDTHFKSYSKNIDLWAGYMANVRECLPNCKEPEE